MGAGCLRRDHQLAIDEESQPFGGVAQVRRCRAQGICKQTRMDTAQVRGKPAGAMAKQTGGINRRLRRPGREAQRQVPERVGGALLPTPEVQRFGTKGVLMLLPAALVGPTGDGAAIRQVHGHGRLGGVRGPLWNAHGLGDFIHRPAGVEAAGQCRSCIEAIALMIESAGAAAGIDVRS